MKQIWNVIVLMLLSIQLSGQQIQDPLQKNIEVIENIKCYYFPNEYNFACFTKSGNDYKFDRFYNNHEAIVQCEELSLILVSTQNDSNESEFLFPKRWRAYRSNPVFRCCGLHSREVNLIWAS